jgi:hypothetical protein
MKKLSLLLAVLFISSAMFAQSYDGKGDKKINFGYEFYGFGNGVTASFDYGISDLFSVGLGGSYYFSNDDNDYYIFARTAIHLGELLDFNEKFDIYPGVDIGYLQRNDIGFGGYLGFRFFFTESFGIFAEFGNTGKAGLSYTF